MRVLQLLDQTFLPDKSSFIHETPLPPCEASCQVGHINHILSLPYEFQCDCCLRYELCEDWLHLF